MRCTKIGVSLAACGIALSLFTAVAHAGDSKVNCSSPGHAGKIANVLSRLNPADTNVVHVSGRCHENLIIQGFDRLSLIAEPGAVIEDASGGQAAVIEILDSQRVLIQGFTIRGGNGGVFCHEYSFCRFIGDTVEQTAAYGAIVVGSSEARFGDVIVRDATDRGIYLFNSKAGGVNVSISNVKAGNMAPGVGLQMQNSRTSFFNWTIQNAAGGGVSETSSSVLDCNQLTVTNNAGGGIGLNDGSNLTSFGLTVTDNGQDGVALYVGATMIIGGVTIGNNQRFGVVLGDGSSASISGGAVTSNGDVGVFVGFGSNLWIDGTTVTANTSVGLLVTDVSSAWILGGMFTQNGIDVSCGGPPPAFIQGIGNAIVGTTDCPPSAMAPGKVPFKGVPFKGPNLPPN